MMIPETRSKLDQNHPASVKPNLGG